MYKTLCKFISAMSIFVIVLQLSVCTFAKEKPIAVYINDTKLVLDTEAQIINGSAYVPMRSILESLGAEINWNDAENSITVIKGKDNYKLFVGKTDVIINGNIINKSPSPLISNGRTLVPLRVVSELLGAQVKWDDDLRRIDITIANASVISKYNSIEGRWVRTSYDSLYGTVIDVKKNADGTYYAEIVELSPLLHEDNRIVVGDTKLFNITKNQDNSFNADDLVYRGRVPFSPPKTYKEKTDEKKICKITVNDDYTELVVKYYDNNVYMSDGSYQTYVRENSDINSFRMQRSADDISVKRLYNSAIYLSYAKKSIPANEANQIIDNYNCSRFAYSEARNKVNRIESSIKTEKILIASLNSKLKSQSIILSQIEKYKLEIAAAEKRLSDYEQQYDGAVAKSKEAFEYKDKCETKYNEFLQRLPK